MSSLFQYICGMLTPGQVICTPSRKSDFKITKLLPNEIELEAGTSQQVVCITSNMIDEAGKFLRNKNDVLIGQVAGYHPDSLYDLFKKNGRNQRCASYVSAILAKAKVAILVEAKIAKNLSNHREAIYIRLLPHGKYMAGAGAGSGQPKP